MVIRGGGSEDLVRLRTSFLKYFITVEVRATGLKLLRLLICCILWDRHNGGILEAFGDNAL